MHLPLSQWKSTGEQVGSTAGEESRLAASKQANKPQIRFAQSGLVLASPHSHTLSHTH